MKPNHAYRIVEPTNEAIQLCRAYAIEQFEFAETTAIFVSGMQPFGADDLMRGRSSLVKDLNVITPWSLSTLAKQQRQRHRGLQSVDAVWILRSVVGKRPCRRVSRRVRS